VRGTELLASDRYLQKGMGLMALTGRRPAEIFFSASFSLPKKLPYPALLFDGQLENLAKPPGTSSLPHPVQPQETCPGPRPTPVAKELSFPRGR
jgi:Telomere resolvase